MAGPARTGARRWRHNGYDHLFLSSGGTVLLVSRPELDPDPGVRRLRIESGRGEGGGVVRGVPPIRAKPIGR